MHSHLSWHLAAQKADREAPPISLLEARSPAEQNLEKKHHRAVSVRAGPPDYYDTAVEAWARLSSQPIGLKKISTNLSYTLHPSHFPCPLPCPSDPLEPFLPLLISFPCPPPLPQKNHSLNAVLGLLAAGFISEARRSHRGLVNVLGQQNKQLNQLIM